MTRMQSTDSRQRRPPSSSIEASQRMKRVRQRDTGLEIALRRELHRAGLRFRIQRQVLASIRRKADVVFPTAKVAIFVDGCFWHACPLHATWPKANADWWREKLTSNVHRDRETDAAFFSAGWRCVRVWGHEDPVTAAMTILALVRDSQHDHSVAPRVP